MIPKYGLIRFVEDGDVSLSYSQIASMCTNPAMFSPLQTKAMGMFGQRPSSLCLEAVKKVQQNMGEQKRIAHRFRVEIPAIDTARQSAHVDFFLFIDASGEKPASSTPSRATTSPTTTFTPSPQPGRGPTLSTQSQHGPRTQATPQPTSPTGLTPGSCNGYIIDSQNKRHVVFNGTVILNQPSRGLVAPGPGKCYGFIVDPQGQYHVVENDKVVK
jgi:hypothetical protein